MINILVVDDETSILVVCTAILTHAGYSVQTTTSPLEALELLKKGSFQLVLTDFKMPEMDGLAMSQKVRELYPAVGIILMTGYWADHANTIQKNQSLFFGVLKKPFQIKELVQMAEKYFNQLSSSKTN